MHYTYVGGIERGERDPALGNIGALAGALGVSLAELFSGSAHDPSTDLSQVTCGSMDRRQQILTLANAIAATFSSSEWTEVGYLTATNEHIDNHSRLFRSLHWGDPDYKGHVIDVVAHIVDADEANLKRLVEYGPLMNWLRENEPRAYESLHADAYGVTVPEVLPEGSQTALAALADAQALLETRGPTSAVDRVHTGLHGYLRGACIDAGLAFEEDDSANRLLKTLLKEHPSLQDLGPRSADIRRVIQTGASIVDAMGTIRNQSSLAHPNDELLGHDEALLAINVSRSLLRYLGSKLRRQG